MPNIRSLLMLFCTAFWAVVAVVSLVVNPTGRLYMAIGRKIWGIQVLRIGGIKLVVKGGEGLDWKAPYVVTANHASQMDIPTVFAALKMPVRFMAKKSLFYIPIFGWSMWLARFIPVDRGVGRKARASINKAAEKVSKGPSLIVFPEGTRSPDGKIHPFKSGAFVLAIKSQVSVLPVAIRGSYDVFPKDSIRVTKGTIEFIIGTPVETTGMKMSDKERLRLDIQERVNQMFETGEPV